MTSSDIFNSRILIVDDQKDNVELIHRMLSRAGYTSVESTMDPLEVCDLHRAKRYDLILLDLMMPIMDGFEVMEGVKTIEAEAKPSVEQCEHLPVLVITAQPEHKERALKAGAKGFITKPFDRLANALVLFAADKLVDAAGAERPAVAGLLVAEHVAA